MASDVEHVTAHTEAATARTATETAHTAPGTIKPSFEPTATAHEKIEKPFFERGFAPSNRLRLLFERGFTSSDLHRFLFERRLTPLDPHRLLFKREFAPSDPHRLLNSRFGNRVNFFSLLTFSLFLRGKQKRKPGKLFFFFYLPLSFLTFYSPLLVLVISIGSLFWFPFLVPYLRSLSSFLV